MPTSPTFGGRAGWKRLRRARDLQSGEALRARPDAAPDRGGPDPHRGRTV